MSSPDGHIPPEDDGGLNISSYDLYRQNGINEKYLVTSLDRGEEEYEYKDIEVTVGKRRREGITIHEDEAMILAPDERAIGRLDGPADQQRLGTKIDKGHQLPAPDAVYFRPGDKD